MLAIEGQCGRADRAPTPGVDPHQLIRLEAPYSDRSISPNEVIYSLSGRMKMWLTGRECPLKTVINFPCGKAHNLTVLSSDAEATRLHPQNEKRYSFPWHRRQCGEWQFAETQIFQAPSNEAPAAASNVGDKPMALYGRWQNCISLHNLWAGRLKTLT